VNHGPVLLETQAEGSRDLGVAVRRGRKVLGRRSWNRGAGFKALPFSPHT
jgi:hypothetical protein